MTESPESDLPREFRDADGTPPPYRVLARKYRPTCFAELVGQEALVRTLTNAIESGRVAQAFMLTGVRGVGKTTTARIIARALNCIGPDGNGGPTTAPCGICESCRAIANDRHVDVLEMDAASHTGVDDIREIIDSVRYSPASARYKLYIIDEVHMLSKNAFNALLKTLEEPPAHVKFVFATTESRKVPVTVLSRCQRFDLRRVSVPMLIEHYSSICTREGVSIEDDALALIARAADGSVRDGLSLLDQAIALTGGAHARGGVAATVVRDMLGLADRTRVIDLFEAALGGTPAEALAILSDLHAGGADAAVIIRDLLELTHTITRFRIVPASLDDPATPEAERQRGRALAQALGVPALTRAWQLLLKGLGEVQTAPQPHQAAEMVVIRLAHAAALPPPAELVQRLSRSWPGGVEGDGGGAAPALGGARDDPPMPPSPRGQAGPSARAADRPRLEPRSDRTRLAPSVRTEPADPVPVPTAGMDLEHPATVPVPASFRAVAELFQARGEVGLHSHLVVNARLVRYEPGVLVLHFDPHPGPDVPRRISASLQAWTGRPWKIVLSDQLGAPSLREQDKEAERQAREEAARHPLVRGVLATFPGAQILEVRNLAGVAPDVDAPDSPFADGDASENGETD